MNNETIDITLLDKSYQVKCPQENVAMLKKSGKYLDKKLKEVRDNKHIIGTDRIAIMTALNICYELLQSNEMTNNDDLGQRLKSCYDKINLALR